MQPALYRTEGMFAVAVCTSVIHLIDRLNEIKVSANLSFISTQLLSLSRIGSTAKGCRSMRLHDVGACVQSGPCGDQFLNCVVGYPDV